jgi:PKD repeat protein
MQKLVQRDAAGGACVSTNADIVPIVALNPSTGRPKTGLATTVQIGCDFTPLTPFISAILSSPIRLGASSVFPTRSAVNVTSNAPALPTAASPACTTSGTIVPVTISCLDPNDANNSATAWCWNFGDAVAWPACDSIDQAPSHTYNAACPSTASYACTVRHTVTNLTGTSSAASESVTARPAVVAAASFTCNPCSGAANLLVAFTDTSTGSPTGWSWTFGDGATATGPTPSHTYTSAGTFTVTLTATYASGGPLTATKLISVTNGYCIVPTFTAGAGDAVTSSSVSTIQTKWSNAGFTTIVIFNPAVGPTSSGKVKSQSLVKSTSQLCNSSITLTWS